MIKLIKEEDCICVICNKKFKNIRGLSQHCKKHGLTSKEYTLQYLLDNEIPKCHCGCGNNCLYYPFQYSEFNSGHNPDSFWQIKYDKDSDKFKSIAEKTRETLQKYYKENPKQISEEERERRSAYMKEVMSDPKEREQRFTKMKETKRRQSEDGTLSDRHWTNVWPEEEVERKLKEIGEKSSKTKKEKQLPAWNKGLTTETDERIKQWSGENNYRYNPKKEIKYSRKFRNKKYRKLILETQGGICFKCKKDDGRQLCLHHVDEDKTNDSFNNLIFVCRSCHIRLHSIEKFMKEFEQEVILFKEQFKNENF